MSQKIFLTSALAMGVIAPAMAEPERVATFPNAAKNEFMQENKVYTNAATADNMDSVYEGEVNAVAEYDIIDYILSAGKYLPADSETITTCPAGSFCAGGTTVQYNQTTPQGIQTCPTGYASSADGSSSNTQCYRACDINNVGDSVTAIAHATAISGNDYYGSGVDTCEPTACEHGWHVKAASSAPNIGTDEGDGYTSNRSTGAEYETENMSNTIIANDPMAFAVDYGNKGIIKGHGRCSTRAGTNAWTNNTYNVIDSNFVSSLADETGQEGAQYCYCQLDGYTPNGGTLQSLSSPWVYGNVYGGASYCAISCADYCAYMRRTSSDALAWRAALVGSVTGFQSGPASCEANVININWYNADAEDISANNAGTATYGSDVRTPVKAQTIKGKTFKGWRFSKPTETNLP